MLRRLSHPVIVLTGPRQVGKTSLLERLFSSYHYVSLDVASNAEMAETQPGGFLALNPPPLVIDEVQYAPGFLHDIKIECKTAERPSGHAARGIQKLRDLYGEQSVRRAFIACTTESRYDIAPGLTVVHGWRTWDLDG